MKINNCRLSATEETPWRFAIEAQLCTHIGKLNDYLADLNEQAEALFSQLVKQLSEKEGVTEALIDLHIKSGETIGVIGGTGCGKSSFANLISRLYDVDTRMRYMYRCQQQIADNTA